jgi:hypothetical protein
MNMLWIVCALALAGKWDGAESDVVVERELTVDVQQTFDLLTDVEALQQLFPEDCVADWALGEPTTGIGANARVTYRMAGMKRRLTLTVSKAEAFYVVELDHPENKGFITQWALSEPGPGRAVVQLGTYLNAPPWPFKGYYYNKVQPAWTDCYTRTLDALDAR